MRVFILTLGTRGDLELFLMLGRQLRRRGHRVVVGTSGFYADQVREAELESAPLGPGTREELVAILQSLAAVPDRTGRTYAYYRRWLRPQLSAATDRIASLAASADYFVSNVKMVLRRGEAVIPGAAVTYDPPASVDELARYGTQAHGGRILDLVAMNKQLVDPDDRWGEPYRFTGFWTDAPSPAWTPPPGLARFLDDGPPPVVVTMGSMVTFDTERLVGTIVRALRLAGQRGLIVGGWAKFSPPPAPDARVDEVPYDWLFPRSSCVIHHGGCGTVAATLRSGKPSILLPQIACQEHFGRMLTAAGLATGSFDVDGLGPEVLAAAVRRAVEDTRIIGTARAWQQTVRAEPGVAAAAEAIEAHWDRLGRP